MFVGWKWRYSPTRPRVGETDRAEIAESFVQQPAIRRVGVAPRGAHVRWMLGMSEKPLSSRKTRWAPRARAFFYMGPAIPLPGRDRSLVPFPCPPRRLLAAPAEAHEQAPDVVGVVAYVEAACDHLGDPSRRPQVRGIAVREGSLQEEPHQRGPLPCGQLRRPAGGGLRGQPRWALRGVQVTP